MENKKLNDECKTKQASDTGINLATYKSKKITFITTHNWDTKRLGGFHKFAEASCMANIETVFFTFPRPYYGLFMKREQLNKKVISTLSKGKKYFLTSDKSILNVTFPTFRLPDSIGRFLSTKFMNFCLTHSFHSFGHFVKKILSGTNCFVFESCEGVVFVDRIKKLLPDAKIIYRPSDPMVFDSVPERVKLLEQNMLYKADKVLIVNDEGVEIYKKCIPDFDKKVKYSVLSNGIDIDSYTKTYNCPEVLKDKKTVLYVGAWEVEWNLIFKAAKETADFNYVVVCPNYPSASIIKEVEKHENVIYVPGIKPSEVPAWITNCNVVMVPYVTDFYKDRPLGITAKYYQAMAAQKPIVAYSDTPKLKDVGIATTYTYEDFISEVKKAFLSESRIYNFNLKDRTWEKVCTAFLKETDMDC